MMHITHCSELSSQIHTYKTVNVVQFSHMQIPQNNNSLPEKQ